MHITNYQDGDTILKIQLLESEYYADHIMLNISVHSALWSHVYFFLFLKIVDSAIIWKGKSEWLS